MDTELDTPIVAVIEPLENPDQKWLAWALWSGISLVLALFSVLALGIDSGLLLGWAVGVIVAAMLMVFGRQ